MGRLRHCVPVWLLLAAVVISGGCAVLTIDVDVYKGSLANNTRVQYEQVAVMAIAAKPLLVSLRDRLEVGKETAALRSEPWYEDSYVRKPSDGLAPTDPNYQWFCKEPAIRVNALLGLYEDLGSGKEYARFSQPAVRAYEDFLSALAVLKPYDDSDDVAWREFSLAMTNDSSLATLKRAYEDYLKVQTSTGFRDTWLVLKEHDALKMKRGWDPLELQGEVITSLADLDANIRYAIIEKSGMVGAHAMALFPKPSDQAVRARFRNRVHRIARSFRESRASIDRMWRAGVDFLVGVSGGDLPPRVRKVVRATESFIAQFVSKHRWGLLDVRTPAEELFSHQQIKPSLRDRGAAMATALLEIHDAAVEHGTGSGASTLSPVERTRWSTGVLSGPTKRSFNGITEIAGPISSAIRSLAESLSFDLDEGRLQRGIPTLVEDYLRSADREPSNPDAARGKRDRLLDALTRFAEKLRFISGYQTILEQSNLSTVRVYVDTLEAVANSVLTQVDSLRNRERYESELADSGYRHERAFNELIGRLNADRSAGQKSKRGRLKGAGSPPDPRKVLAEITATLNFELAHEMRSGNDPEKVEGIRAAIGAIEQYRSGRAFLQPASAFLRNSYPASSLQKSSLTTWSNSLGEHALRQIPVVGDLQENQGRAQTIQDIDKQFWQNVNRVRLSGAGTTNYVIAKDDIGNWYAKEFSSDPAEIIEGMRGLALYAAQGAISAKALKDAAGQLEGEDVPTNQAEGVILSNLIDRAEKQKKDATAALYGELVLLPGTAENALVQGWATLDLSGADAEAKTKNRTALRLALRAASSKLPALSTETDTPATALMDGAGQMVAWRDKVFTSISKTVMNNEKRKLELAEVLRVARAAESPNEGDIETANDDLVAFLKSIGEEGWETPPDLEALAKEFSTANTDTALTEADIEKVKKVVNDWVNGEIHGLIQSRIKVLEEFSSSLEALRGSLLGQG